MIKNLKNLKSRLRQLAIWRERETRLYFIVCKLRARATPGRTQLVYYARSFLIHTILFTVLSTSEIDESKMSEALGKVREAVRKVWPQGYAFLHDHTSEGN